MIEPQNKNLLKVSEFGIKYKEDDRSIDMYLELDTKQITDLIKESLKGKGFDDDRKFIKNCIFFRKIQTPVSSMKGNFHITYLAYKGLSLNVFLQSEHVDTITFFKSQLNFKTQDNWRSKWVYGSVESKDEDGLKSKVFKAEISTVDVDEILREKLLVNMVFHKEVSPNREFTGLENSGNICYMNSILQVLFNFIPFRKLVMEHNTHEKSDVNKLIENLQEKFMEMINANKRTVNADVILNHFKEFDAWPRQQHDIHEFLIKFLDCTL